MTCLTPHRQSSLETGEVGCWSGEVSGGQQYESAERTGLCTCITEKQLPLLEIVGLDSNASDKPDLSRRLNMTASLRHTGRQEVPLNHVFLMSARYYGCGVITVGKTVSAMIIRGMRTCSQEVCLFPVKKMLIFVKLVSKETLQQQDKKAEYASSYWGV